MSLLYYAINEEFGSTCIWQMDEENSFYSERLIVDTSIIPDLSGQRLKEWLATRYLARLVDKVPVQEIMKDEYGKPYTSSGLCHISISHSKKYAVYASYHDPIGIDLQIEDPRLIKLAPKFTSEEESNILPEKLKSEHKYLYIWTIKEAVFKLYGRKKLPYKSSIIIEKSQWKDNHLQTFGRIQRDDQSFEFICNSLNMKDFVCTNAVYVAEGHQTGIS